MFEHFIFLSYTPKILMIKYHDEAKPIRPNNVGYIAVIHLY